LSTTRQKKTRIGKKRVIVGLIPLELGAGQPGKEIQQRVMVVILGGIDTSTVLNMIVIPALYLKFGRAESSVTSAEYPREGKLASTND
jgi:Cu/Ag efflux pump CusA